jgi:hypothetical protein
VYRQERKMARKNDTDFLKERVDKRDAISAPVQQLPSKSVLDNSSRFIEDATQDENDQGIVRRKLHKRALALQAADTSTDEREAERVLREEALAEQQRRREASNNIVDKIHMAGDTARGTVGPLADKVSNTPTPGSVGFLLLILLILMLTVVVVNSHGDTRLKQLWYMLNGRATIAGRTDVTRYNPPDLTGTNAMQNGANTTNIPSSNSPFKTPPIITPLDFLPNFNPGF